MTNTINAELIAAVQAKLEQIRVWRDQCGKANELRACGWIVTPPGALVTGLVAAAIIGAEAALREEQARQAAAAEAETEAEAKRIDSVYWGKFGMSRADWERQLAESKKAGKP